MKTFAPEFTRRLERVQGRVAELELGGLLVCHLPNIRYLTGFSGSNGWLLIAEDRCLFATDRRYEMQAGEELTSDADIELVVSQDGTLTALLDAAGFSRGRLGFEPEHLTYAEWERLGRIGSDVEWLPTVGLIEGLRAVKDDAEIHSLREAAEIAIAAFEQVVGLVEPGVCELELAAELDFRLRRNGADGPAFETIVASGPRSAFPHARSGTRALEEGDLLLCDFGAHWHGYCSDLTRTLVVGEPTARQEEVLQAVLAAGEAACAALRTGARAAEVDAAARAAFAARGLAERFAHSTGHGIGLEVHEAPRLRRRSDERLARNMVVTVEPGLYFSGWGGIRIEDDYIVTDGRPEPLVRPSGGGVASSPPSEL